MEITLIVAASTNHAIGRNGALLWHLPRDLKFFKNQTWAMPVIMGRKTFASMGKALPGRTNIVVTTQRDWQAEDVVVVHSLEEALQAADTLQTREAYCIGGGTLYRQALPLAHRIFMTRVHAVVPDADTYFPEIDPRQWRLRWEQPFSADDRHAVDFTFQCWEREVPEAGDHV